MRKITQGAVNAFYNGYYFKSGNTVVDVTPIPHGRYEIVMKLHNNPIAISNNGELTINSCGWRTTTTKERLNGVLSKFSYGIYQKKGVWYLTDYCNSEKHDIEFYDGMKITIK